MTHINRRHPFGEISCEREIKTYKEEYRSLYFDEAPFNTISMDANRYLIVGRRGTGKSSLVQYFKFQDSLPRAKYIEVDQPILYSYALEKLSSATAQTSELAIDRLVGIWNFLIWSAIFDEFYNWDSAIRAASAVNKQEKPSAVIKAAIDILLKRFLGEGSTVISDALEQYLQDPIINSAKKEVLKITREIPVIIAIDSLERYDINDDAIMWSTAALIQCASDFNDDFSEKGLYLKVFVTAEIYPVIRDQVIQNVSKYIRDPVYLHWRPRDLIRLASWRLHNYLLKYHHHTANTHKDLDWSSFDAVMAHTWIPYFPDNVVNSCGISERTFPYIVRHTQMRPRQLVMICNKISEYAVDEKTFPVFSANAVHRGVKDTEKELAEEMYNSYTKTYENLSNIIEALSGSPVMFKGKYLHKIAPETASEWKGGDYSKSRFCKMLTELGAVGRVRSYDEPSGIVQADFEYAHEDNIAILSNEDYVIHPMFFEKLNVKEVNNLIVLPFPDKPSYEEMIKKWY